MTEAILRGAAFGAIALIWAIALVRVLGLRSLSKISAFDFLTTLATGSLLATAASASSATAVVQALVAMLVLMGLQTLLARARRWRRFRRLIENEPIVLVQDGRLQDQALHRVGITPSDVYAKLREARIEALDSVELMTLEVTGDVVVMTNRPRDARLLEEVAGTSRANASLDRGVEQGPRRDQ